MPRPLDDRLHADRRQLNWLRKITRRLELHLSLSPPLLRRHAPTVRVYSVGRGAQVKRLDAIITAISELPKPVQPRGETMSLLRVLDELDRVQKMLEEEFPDWKIGYSYNPGRVTWSAQLGPTLNEDSPGALRDSIKRAYTEVLEKISERTRGTSPTATGE